MRRIDLNRLRLYVAIDKKLLQIFSDVAFFLLVDVFCVQLRFFGFSSLAARRSCLRAPRLFFCAVFPIDYSSVRQFFFFFRVRAIRQRMMTSE